MQRLAKLILNVLSRMRWSSRFAAISIGRESQVYLWRIHPRYDGCTLRIGDQSMVQTRLTIEREGGCLTVGHRSFVGEGQISCACRIEVGDDVMIAWGTTIFDHASHSLRFSERANDVANWLRGTKDWDRVDMAPVRICSKAWIGFGSIVLPGITIGEGAVVGAGSVVTRDVAPWTVVAGNPARTIREIADDER